MGLQMKVLLIWLLSLKQVHFAVTQCKFVYQKDMSEYCRRRVIPSVFLGTHVAEAHSQILYFSKLELPYSCLISIRTEMGSNLILVAQLVSETSLDTACSYYPDQLLVYEMGETFGGYWGPLPEAMMHPSSTHASVYTHKGTKYETVTFTTEEPTSPERVNNYTLSGSSKIDVPKSTEQDYIVVEVPLLNLTGDLGNLQNGQAQFDDAFDLLYDVTPGSQEQYVTSELPVVKFSIDRDDDSRRSGVDTMLDIEDGGGSDTPIEVVLPKFSLRPTMKKKSSPRTYKKTRPYTRHKTFYSVTRKPISSKPRFDETVRSWDQIEDLLRGLSETYLGSTKYMNESENITELLESLSKLNHNYSLYLQPNWKSIDNIGRYHKTALNKLKFGTFTRKLQAHPTLATRNVYQLLKSTMFFNFTNNFPTTKTDLKDNSVAQITASTMPVTMENKTPVTTENITAVTTENIPSVTTENITSVAKENTTPVITENTTQITTTNDKKMVENNVYLISNSTTNGNLSASTYTTEPSVMISNVTTPSESTLVLTKEMGNTTRVVSTKNSPVTPGSMVDHESWENVVQAAPVMAVLLNRTVPGRGSDVVANTTSSQKNTTTAIRKKRWISPIPIKDARPHSFTTPSNFGDNETESFYPSDMANFAQLVELQDDELHDRVALRYLRHYVGPILFNICEFSEPKSRLIFMFNSSRIVLAINNFTLERMSVVLTPAQTLVGGYSKCSERCLECQVFGTRVCIDKINACDGVPNCGAFDIYDEDRLTCGAAIGLQHNVYLAAITFLAVLLTLLYTVHYWLKRCVPKVSEAFFVYTDSAENILYLESIMRSPHDGDDHKTLNRPSFFMLDDTSHDTRNKIHRSICYRMWQCCFKFITCKRKEKIDPEFEMSTRDQRGPSIKYSFTQLELQKISKPNADVSVQTGDSLETPSLNDEHRQTILLNKPSTSYHKESRNQSMELEILKRLKETKTPCKEPCPCLVSPDKSSLREVELYTYNLNSNETFTDFTVQATLEPQKPTRASVKDSPRPETSKQAVKHLRFDEEALTIPTSDIEGEDKVPSIPSVYKKVLGETEDEDSNAGVRKDRRRFWASKTKKSKKKQTHHTLSSLHLN